MSKLALVALLLAALSVSAPHAQTGGRAAIPPEPHATGGVVQTAGGGRGPGAAPMADDPANAGADLSPKPPVVALPPSEQAKRFWLQPGYRMEPLLSEPLIDSPGAVTFDGNGRMFVVELRSYVQTLDGVDSISPIGRISLHEDRDNDGTFEIHRVFVDKLLFPRFAMPLGANTILVSETNADEVWKYTDTNDDGVADKKELFATNFGRGGSLESQPSGLFWALDNWMYSTVNAFRMRWTPTGVLREPTGPNGAQWSAVQDDDGKVWFQHGASGMPGYFQFPVAYGNFAWPEQFEPELNIMWGAPIRVGDIQAGLPGTRMPDGSLMYGTASAGNDIFRGDRLPKDVIGDYFYGEEVARVVRRLKPVKTDGLTQLRNAHPSSEFLRSLDPLFRPVDMATGPDGVMYIADMYRGIIEGAQWAMRGRYLRQKIEQYGLDKVNDHGRVWRLTYDGLPRDRTKPRMLSETAAQLVGHLDHPNGWWRDTAQQLLVLKQDKSVVPSLQRIVRTSRNLVGRFHAMWTLEGLGALDATLVRQAMADPEPRLRIQAIRASESLYKAGDKSFAGDWRKLAEDKDTDVVIQSMLTLNLLRVPDAAVTVKLAMNGRPAKGVQFVGERILNPPANMFAAGGRGGAALSTDQQASFTRGATVYAELCFSCHGEDGRGTPVPGGKPGTLMAPSLVGAPRVAGHRDYVIKTLLHGLAGPLDDKTYPEVMVPMGSNTDQWIADVATFVRNTFGNSAPPVSIAEVARVRTATPGRNAQWTLAELSATLPRPLVTDPSWKVTASHNNDGAAGALTYTRWTSEAPQQPDMWLQVELPTPAVITEVQFDSLQAGGARGGPPPAGTFPRGYRVEVSGNGTTWTPVAEGEGTGRTTAIPFAPSGARFVRITQTATVPNAPVWTVERLRLYELRK